MSVPAPTEPVITLELVRDKWDACYKPERLAELFAEPRSVMYVLTMAEGPWANVPIDDRFWVVVRKDLVPTKTLRLFACDCAERALAQVGGSDPRLSKAVEVSRRFAAAKATLAELAAARSAARSATRSAALYAARSATRSAALYAARSAACSAACSATRSAALYAARSAALYAARSAARYAERYAARYAERYAKECQWQRDHLVEMLGGGA